MPTDTEKGQDRKRLANAEIAGFEPKAERLSVPHRTKGEAGLFHTAKIDRLGKLLGHQLQRPAGVATPEAEPA
jgi:hypothetical protein